MKFIGRLTDSGVLARIGIVLVASWAVLTSFGIDARADGGDCDNPECPVEEGLCLGDYAACPDGYSWQADLNCDGIYKTLCERKPGT